MLYVLTQHSYYNRVYYHFIFVKIKSQGPTKQGSCLWNYNAKGLYNISGKTENIGSTEEKGIRNMISKNTEIWLIGIVLVSYILEYIRVYS